MSIYSDWGLCFWESTQKNVLYLIEMLDEDFPVPFPLNVRIFAELDALALLSGSSEGMYSSDDEFVVPDESCAR